MEHLDCNKYTKYGGKGYCLVDSKRCKETACRIRKEYIEANKERKDA